MQKVFALSINNDNVILSDEDKYHFEKVLRFKTNTEFISIFENKKYLCHVDCIKPFSAKVNKELNEDINNEFEMNIFHSSIKPNHLEISIVKACEMNVNNFYIFQSSLSQNNIKHNLERYKKLIKSAAEQSNRSSLMNIEIINNDDLIKKIQINDLTIVAHLCGTKNKEINNLLKSKQKIGIIIGPEGGFNKNDIMFFDQFNVEYLHLTKTILRAETAALYLISIISFLKLKE
ncbi:MAG: RsmE family RNA methyltransferase [Mycoplasma sp.]